MKIAILSADDRETRKRYASNTPIIPTPQEALLEGFLSIPDIEIHFVSCFQKHTNFPKQLNANTFSMASMYPALAG